MTDISKSKSVVVAAAALVSYQYSDALATTSSLNEDNSLGRLVCGIIAASLVRNYRVLNVYCLGIVLDILFFLFDRSRLP